MSAPPADVYTPSPSADAVKPLKRSLWIVLLGIKGCTIFIERDWNSLGTHNIHLSAHVDTLELETRLIACTVEVRTVLKLDRRDLIGTEHARTLTELVVTGNVTDRVLLGSSAIT